MTKFNKVMKIRAMNPAQPDINWSQYFKDRKLEDLLIQFSQRKCKSVFEGETGWQLHDDPREEYTWPISPDLQDEMVNKVQIKFSAADAYDQNWDNVYFETKAGVKVRDMNIQANDGERQEFQDALNRKQNEMLIASFLDASVTEDLVKIRTARKRGRNNKYYHQIDDEDELNQKDLDKNGEEQAMLALVKEQEVEEEQLKHSITEDTVRAREIAADRQLRKQELKAKKRAEDAAIKRAQRKEREELELRARQEAEIEYAKV
jgi:hypothetical protein